MRQRLLVVMGVAAMMPLVSVTATVWVQAGTGAAAQTAPAAQTTARPAPAAKGGPAPKTGWGDPDLQGIWTDDYQTPMQRPTTYANKEFFTPDEQAALDNQRAALLRREVRVERGTEKDVAGA